jgi:dihydroorotase
LLLPQTLAWAAHANCQPAQALAKVTYAAARILGIQAGHLSPGAVADICLYDPDAHWRVSAASLTSQGKNTPFLGHEVRGEVVLTLVAGQVVYEKPTCVL